MAFSAGSESVTVDAWRISRTVRINRVDVDGSDRLVATLDAAAASVPVDEVAAELDGAPRAAVLIPGKDRLVVAAGRDGVRIDRSGSLSVLVAAVFEQGEPDRGVVLPATIEAPTLSTADAQRFADSVHLVGGFTTYFPVNQARATNIGLAADHFDGMVVGPGESFSFWGRIGEVSPRTGYVFAGAIVGGVSSTAIGGGLCQVSRPSSMRSLRPGWGSTSATRTPITSSDTPSVWMGRPSLHRSTSAGRTTAPRRSISAPPPMRRA